MVQIYVLDALPELAHIHFRLSIYGYQCGQNRATGQGVGNGIGENI